MCKATFIGVKTPSYRATQTSLRARYDFSYKGVGGKSVKRTPIQMMRPSKRGSKTTHIRSRPRDVTYEAKGHRRFLKIQEVAKSKRQII